MNLFMLYIDPGTGSALFSILIGVAATVYFLGRALIIKLKVVLSGGKFSASSGGIPFVIYNEGRQYWNVFKPVVEQFEAHKTELRYLTSASDDPVFGTSWKYVKPEFIGEGNKAFTYLNFLHAEIVVMTTPGLDVYQLKRSKNVKHYSHIIHGITDATTYRMFGLDYFDSILLTGDYQGNDIRFLEKLRNIPEKQLVTTGCSYLDVYAEKIKQIPPEKDHPYTVLVSPSWGPSALLSRYGEKLLDPLSACNWRIIIRPHPQSSISEKPMLNSLQSRYSGCHNFIWDYDCDNIFSLSKADIMISDFSGIIFDYLCLCDKPVLYANSDFDPRPYDADDLDHTLWQFKALTSAGIKLTEEDFPNIKNIIENARDSEALALARKSACETAWQCRGKAGEKTFSFMLDTVKNS